MCGAITRCFLTCNQIVGRNICQPSDLNNVNVLTIPSSMQRLVITCDSKRLQSIHTPFPVCWRDISAAIMAPWAYKPVAISVAATPTLAGGRSGSPVLEAERRQNLVIPGSDRSEAEFTNICMRPASASIITSYPAAVL